MRKLIFKLHLWLSIPTGIVISVVCLSGAALVFEKEIRERANPSFYYVEKTATEKLPPGRLVRILQSGLPDSLEVGSLQYYKDAKHTCQVGFVNKKGLVLYADPYTGEIKGWTDSGRGFWGTMRKLHRWLLDDYKRGEFFWGKTAVGISTLLFVFILLSGLIVWIPKSRKALRNRLTISCRKGWHRFWYDSHVATGFYAALFLLIMALTGLTWSFGWYRTGFYSLFGGGARQTMQTGTSAHRGNEKSGRNGKEEIKRYPYEVWNNALQNVEKYYESYDYVILQKKQVQVAADVNTQRRKLDTAEFDQETGVLRNLTVYDNLSREQKLRGWVYAIHTGSWGGVVIKGLTFLASLAGGVLPLTGYYLWLKKKNRRRKVL